MFVSAFGKDSDMFKYAILKLFNICSEKVTTGL